MLGTKVPRSIFDQQITQGASHAKPLSGLGEAAIAIPGDVTVFDHGLVLSLEIVKHLVPVNTAVITDLLRKALSRPGALR